MVTLDYFGPLTHCPEMLEFGKRKSTLSFRRTEYEMTIPHLQNALWISQPILEISVVVILFAQKKHRTFPVFFSYLIAQVLMFCVLFPMQKLNAYNAYFYGYWIGALISLGLGFKVIYEIFQDVFRPYHALKDLGSVLFKWSGLVMLLAGIVIAAASPSSQQGSLMEAFMITQRGVRVIQCGLILFLLVFSKHLGVSWKQNSFGIALGFGFYAAVELGAFALYSSGRESVRMVALVTGGAYCLTTGIWLGYALLKTFPREISANLLTPQRWNQSLAEVQSPGGRDSLIPMFEGMVDRAFSRTPGQSFMTSYALEKPISGSYLKADSDSPAFGRSTGSLPTSLSLKF